MRNNQLQNQLQISEFVNGTFRLSLTHRGTKWLRSTGSSHLSLTVHGTAKASGE